MLVMSANQGNSVTMTLPDGRTITVTLVEIKSRRIIRWGFTAPADVQIVRDDAVSTTPKVRP